MAHAQLQEEPLVAPAAAAPALARATHVQEALATWSQEVQGDTTHSELSAPALPADNLKPPLPAPIEAALAAAVASVVEAAAAVAAADAVVLAEAAAVSAILPVGLVV